MLQIRTILVPTDFSESAQRALAHALHLAGRFRADVHLLYIGEQAAPDVGDALEDLLAEETGVLERSRSEEGAQQNSGRPELRPVRTVPVQRTAESPAAGILAYAAEHDADLIVMGTHGRHGLDRLLIGSTAAEVVRQARCPVLTVRTGKTSVPGQGLRHILVPLDFSAASGSLVRHARELAAVYGADLDLLHVVEHPGLSSFYKADRFAASVPKLGTFYYHLLQELAEETEGPAVPIRYQVLIGDPAGCILDLAEAQDADLILLATHGQSGLKQHLLGSVAERVIRAAPCLVGSLRGSGKSLVALGPEAGAAFAAL